MGAVPHRFTGLVRGSCLVESIKLKLFEVCFTIRCVCLPRLLLLPQDMPAEDEHVHIGHHKTAIRIFGRAYDWLAAHVEAGVDQHRATGLLVEACQQLMN